MTELRPTPLTIAGEKPELSFVQRPVGESTTPAPSDQGIVSSYDQKWNEQTKPRASLKSMAGTAAVQGVRGMLDSILAPGALLGSYYEGLGEVSGQDWLRDFGRGLAESSSGKSAMQTGAMVFNELGIGDKNISVGMVDQKLKKMEEEHPWLSVIFRTAGTVAPAAATGLAGAGRAGIGALASAGAYEGAALSSQAAYEQELPLRDVLTSTLLGGAFGGALGAVPGVAGAALRRGGKKAIAEAAEGAAVSTQRAGGKEAYTVLREIDELKDGISRAARQSGVNPNAQAAARVTATQRAKDALLQKAGPADAVSEWSKVGLKPVQKFVHRSRVLDEIGAELSDDIARAPRRPSVDFELDPKRVQRMVNREGKKQAYGALKGADEELAIGQLQAGMREMVSDVPVSPDGAEVAVGLRKALAVLNDADDAGQAMAAGHHAVRVLSRAATQSNDPLLKAFAERATRGIQSALTDESFGYAGKIYGDLIGGTDEVLALSNPAKLREVMRTVQKKGDLLSIVEKRNKAVQQAWGARYMLTGERNEKAIARGLQSLSERASQTGEALEAVSKQGKSSIKKALDGLENKVAKAEDAVTLDGNPMARIFDIAANKTSDKVVSMLSGAAGGILGGPIGAVAAWTVSNAVAPVIRKSLAPALLSAGKKAAPHAAVAAKETGKAALRALRPVGNRATADAMASNEDRQKLHRERLAKLSKAASDPNHEEASDALAALSDLPEGLDLRTLEAMQEKVTALLSKLPRAEPHIGGEAFERLSAQDLKRSESMWEATMAPFSIFEDFARGTVDYEKVKFVWEQYPGLKTAAQAAFMDVIQTQMSAPTRAKLPMSALNKWDYLLDFQGELQKTLKRDFSARFTALGVQEQKRPKPQPSPAVSSKMAEHRATYSERLMGR